MITNSLSWIHHRLPERLQPITKRMYFNHILNQKTPQQIKREFVSRFFTSVDEYRQYKDEFRNSDIPDIREEMIQRRTSMEGTDSLGDVGLGVGERYYALVRKFSPERIIETGVGHGFSTLCILFGLKRNEVGTLYSIDYPRTIDESIEEFRRRTYNDYGGSSAIPPDKQPGYLIPDHLQDQWSLRLGKSQRELPKLVSNLDEIGLFIHDSEHSLPCMLFEFEVAWEWLAEGGLLISDDIHWNAAFDEFVTERCRSSEWGELAPDVGYVVRPPREY